MSNQTVDERIYYILKEETVDNDGVIMNRTYSIIIVHRNAIKFEITKIYDNNDENVYFGTVLGTNINDIRNTPGVCTVSNTKQKSFLFHMYNFYRSIGSMDSSSFILALVGIMDIYGITDNYIVNDINTHLGINVDIS